MDATTSIMSSAVVTSDVSAPASTSLTGRNRGRTWSGGSIGSMASALGLSMLPPGDVQLEITLEGPDVDASSGNEGGYHMTGSSGQGGALNGVIAALAEAAHARNDVVIHVTAGSDAGAPGAPSPSATGAGDAESVVRDAFQREVMEAVLAAAHTNEQPTDAPAPSSSADVASSSSSAAPSQGQGRKFTLDSDWPHSRTYTLDNDTRSSGSEGGAAPSQAVTSADAHNVYAALKRVLARPLTRFVITHTADTSMEAPVDAYDAGVHAHRASIDWSFHPQALGLPAFPAAASSDPAVLTPAPVHVSPQFKLPLLPVPAVYTHMPALRLSGSRFRVSHARTRASARNSAFPVPIPDVIARVCEPFTTYASTVVDDASSVADSVWVGAHDVDAFLDDELEPDPAAGTLPAAPDSTAFLYAHATAPAAAVLGAHADSFAAEPHVRLFNAAHRSLRLPHARLHALSYSHATEEARPAFVLPPRDVVPLQTDGRIAITSYSTWGCVDMPTACADMVRVEKDDAWTSTPAPGHALPCFLLTPGRVDSSGRVQLHVTRLLRARDVAPVHVASVLPSAAWTSAQLNASLTLTTDPAHLPFAFGFVQQFTAQQAEHASSAGISAPVGVLPHIPVDVLPAGQGMGWEPRPDGFGLKLSLQERIFKLARWQAKRERALARSVIDVVAAARARDRDSQLATAVAAANAHARATAHLDAHARVVDSKSEPWQRAAEVALIEAFGSDGAAAVHAMTMSPDTAIALTAALVEQMRALQARAPAASGMGGLPAASEEDSWLKAQHAQSLVRKWASMSPGPAPVTLIDVASLVTTVSAARDVAARAAALTAHRMAAATHMSSALAASGHQRTGVASAPAAPAEAAQEASHARVGAEASMQLTASRGVAPIHARAGTTSLIPARMITSNGDVRVNGRVIPRAIAEELTAMGVGLTQPALVNTYAQLRRSCGDDPEAEHSASENLAIVNVILEFVRSHSSASAPPPKRKSTAARARPVRVEPSIVIDDAWVLAQLQHAQIIIADVAGGGGNDDEAYAPRTKRARRARRSAATTAVEEDADAVFEPDLLMDARPTRRKADTVAEDDGVLDLYDDAEPPAPPVVASHARSSRSRGRAQDRAVEEEDEEDARVLDLGDDYEDDGADLMDLEDLAARARAHKAGDVRSRGNSTAGRKRSRGESLYHPPPVATSHRRRASSVDAMAMIFGIEGDGRLYVDEHVEEPPVRGTRRERTLSEAITPEDVSGTVALRRMSVSLSDKETQELMEPDAAHDATPSRGQRGHTELHASPNSATAAEAMVGLSSRGEGHDDDAHAAEGKRSKQRLSASRSRRR